MTTQPEALQMATWLEQECGFIEEAAELRRLHEENECLKARQQEPTLQEQLDDALQSLDFYRRRVQALQQWQSKMRDPERTIVCDIIANGCTLEPAGDRYKQPAQRQEPVAALQRVMARLADLLDEDQFAEIEGMVTGAGVTPPPRQPPTDEQKDAARWRWLSWHIKVAWDEGKFTSLVRIVSDKDREALNASIDRMMAGDWSDAEAAHGITGE